jgi:heterodisulfide reductase subunit B
MKHASPIFWGCTFTHNYPFLIKSTRKVLDKIGIETSEVPDFSCCPDPVYLKTYGKDINLALSARNLALAEKKNNKLIVACNGCYNVLHEAAGDLSNKKTRDRVNETLPELLKYGDGVEVVHLLKILHEKLPIIKTMIKQPLTGLKVAAHYGCHALYPPAVPSDNPKNPASLEELINATGAENINYDSKLDCCGVPVISFDKEEGDRLLQKKLWDIKDKADCIVTMCPACFMRFDMLPAELKDQGVPVLHITELLCLAMGVPSEELFFEGHSTKVAPLLEKIGMEKISESEKIAKNFDMTEVASHCEACREECVAAITTRNSEKPFDPLFAVDKIKEGRLNELIDSPEIWRCLQCGKCSDNCPNNLGLKDLYAKLREIALSEGKASRIMEDKMKMLEETCYAMPKRAGIRKKMGMELAHDIDSKEIKEILEKAGRKKK